ncbi:hypothetical protein I3760_16G106700 [Carya illinoinensis]|nr:hypothetical protein I3760_16G106700 [Carya illinoinensis]
MRLFKKNEGFLFSLKLLPGKRSSRNFQPPTQPKIRRSIKFREGRVRHGRAEICRSQERELEAPDPRTMLRDELEPDDSTEDVGGAGTEGALGGEEVEEVVVPNTEPPTNKRGRGPAKGTLFERMRKVGKIPLVIKDGHRGPSCENACLFTGRPTEIIKIHADMRHASWSRVPEDEKIELIDHVRADFVLDWSRDNHREMVSTHLADNYNTYHYVLHKIYLKYASHQEALRGGTDKVEKNVWEKLCEYWASEKSMRNSSYRSKLKVKHTGGRKSFIRILEEKQEAALNMVAFYKQTHWSTRKGKWINAATEHNYRLAEKDSEEDIEEAAESVFKEVLGNRPGYAVGRGHMVIPDPSPSMKNSRAYIRLSEENAWNKTEAEMYKAKLDSMLGDIVELRKNFSEHEKLLMSYRNTDLPDGSEAHRETQRDD